MHIETAGLSRRPKQHHQKVSGPGGGKNRSVLSFRGRGFDCFRPSKVKDGWYCRPFQLFHCYWLVWSPRSHHRRKSLGGWILEECGLRLGDVPNRAFGGFRQLRCCSGSGCLGNTVRRFILQTWPFDSSCLWAGQEKQKKDNYQWNQVSSEVTSCQTLLGVRSTSGSGRGPCVREPSPSAPGETSALQPQFLHSPLGSSAWGPPLKNNIKMCSL